MGNFTAKKPKNIRENNAKLLLSLYTKSKSLSVSQLTKRLQLSKTTLFKINDQLVASSLVLPEGKGSASLVGGKRPELYALNKDYGYVLCYHIQYQSIQVQLMNMRLETVVSLQVPIETDLDIHSVCMKMKELHEQVRIEQPLIHLLGVVVSVHALVDAKNGICLHATRFPSWGLNIPLASLISTTLQVDVEVFVDSWIQYKTLDISAFIEQEYHTNRFLLIDAGKYGVVAGIPSHLEGEPLYAGEVGHMIVNPYDEGVCRCGGRGCLESMLDYDRILQRARSLQKEYPDSLLFTADTLDMQHIFSSFQADDPLSVLLMEEVAHWLSIALSNINLMFFSHLVVFEGDFCSAGPKWEQMLREKTDNISMVRMKNKLKLVFHATSEDEILHGSALWVRNRSIQNLQLAP
ncbi:MAG: ROK family transcriptional regulator [Sphaerochaeta sp.]